MFTVGCPLKAREVKHQVTNKRGAHCFVTDSPLRSLIGILLPSLSQKQSQKNEIL